jgi:hypothetical protein
VPRTWADRLPGFDCIDAFLDSVAAATARQPWLERSVACLRGVTPMHLGKAGRVLRDAEGRTLGLGSTDVWGLFAISGGAPVDVTAEWNGQSLLVLSAVVDRVYHPLSTGAA